jgi:hypothetical protein
MWKSHRKRPKGNELLNKATRLKPHIFPATTRCIYCESAGDLTLEHIIPKSLSGALLLPKGSCINCAEVIKKFEQTCARTMFGPLRVSYGFPTRRKKERPAEFLVEKTDADGATATIAIKAADYPKLLFMLQLCHLPAVLHHGGIQIGDAIKPFVVATELTDFSPHVGQTLGKFDAYAFGRLVAKIGHGLASAALGPNDFKPLATDLILGRSDDLTRIVGGLREVAPPTDTLHWLRLRDHLCLPARKRYVVAHVRLFACFGAPTYLVAVGERDWNAPALSMLVK